MKIFRKLDLQVSENEVTEVSDRWEIQLFTLFIFFILFILYSRLGNLQNRIYFPIQVYIKFYIKYLYIH